MSAYVTSYHLPEQVNKVHKEAESAGGSVKATADETDFLFLR